MTPEKNTSQSPERRRVQLVRGRDVEPCEVLEESRGDEREALADEAPKGRGRLA
jgi:hypothetical protein